MSDDEGGPKIIDDPGGSTQTIQVDISQTTTYDGGRMKVTKMDNVTVTGGSQTQFNFYIHTLLVGGEFTLSNTIKSAGTLDGETSDISDVYEVYYYKHNNQNKGALKVKAMNGDKIFYNTTINNGGQWKNEATESVPATHNDLRTLVDRIKEEVEIKIDKIKPYGCNKRIKVAKYEGSETSQKVPNGYVRYKHSSTSTTFKLGIVRYNYIPLKFAENPPTDVKAVYVYYHNDDPKHEFPLIVCVKESATSWKYYKRGQTWTVETQLNTVNPDDANAATGDLQTKLNDLKDKYEVKLGETGGYTANPNNGRITVTAVNEQQAETAKYKGFKHFVGTTGVINRVTIHGQVITQITNSDLNQKKYVFVYFKKEDADGAHQKPLLICLSKDGTSSNKESNGNNIWYERKNISGSYTWQSADSTYENIKPGGTSGTTIEQNLKRKLEEIKDGLTGDPGYPKLEPNLSDTMKSNPDIGIMDFLNL